MKPPKGPKMKQVAKQMKYSKPISESSEAGQKRMKKDGSLKKGYKFVEHPTDSRIPLNSVAIPKQPKNRKFGTQGPRVGKLKTKRML